MYNRKYDFDWWFGTLQDECADTPRWASILQFIEKWCEPLGLREAPAARYHHGSFPGGLIDHMSRVMDIALNVAPTAYHDMPSDSVALCAGLHDLCKLGMMINGKPVPRYIPDKRFVPTEDVSKDNAPYLYNKELSSLAMSLQNCGIAWAWLSLSLAEWKAISFHDGMYVPENRNVFQSHQAEPLLLTIHFADITALQYELGRSGAWRTDMMLGRP